MPPDLVGVVIPAYIGALSSLAGVIVAIVALVTARRARADARAATAETGRVAAREGVTRDAVVELAAIAQQIAAAAPLASDTSMGGPPGIAAADVPRSLRAPSGSARIGGGRSRRRPVSRGSRSAPTEDAVARRPYWARVGSPGAIRSAQPGTATGDSSAGADPSSASDVERRLADLVARLSDDG